MTTMTMRTRIQRSRPWLQIAAAAAAAGILGGCNSVLDVTPTSSIPTSTAIVDAQSAQSALSGAYNALQSTDYYGGSYLTFTEVSSDNGAFTGTYTTYADADQNKLVADNSVVASMWAVIYDAINRANQIIATVPSVQMDTATRNQMLGEAYFLRALNYHNLVRLWGGVPIRTTPTTSAADAASATRATVPEVYAQILADLSKAGQLLTDNSVTRTASPGAVKAIEARVRLYMGDWAGAEAAAAAVEDMGYELAPNFSDLFSASGADTPEDIFRVIFTPKAYNLVGYYYLTRSLGGRWEVAPTKNVMSAFDSSFTSSSSYTEYNPTNPRAEWTIALNGSRRYAAKFPTSVGDEDIHVIRFAEVILIRAEALARLGRLTEAVAELNRVRERAGVAPYVAAGMTQDQVIAAVLNERRLELAFEGDRWPDLIRTGLAASTLGIPATQALYPIPQRDIDVAPGLGQNPGY